MKKKKNMDKRKLLGTVLGVIAFVTFAIYFTYAWYSWKSENSTVNLTIKDSSIECTVGPSVDVKNIGPVLNIEDGVKTSFSLKNTGSSELSVSVGLNITSISSALRVDSFKWALFKGTAEDNFDYDATPLFTGTFSKLSVGNNTLTSALKVAADSTSYFQFVVYIDGNVSNPEAMMNGSLKATLSYGDCNVQESTKKLADMEVGSYVQYSGENGCESAACDGQNANYESDSQKGYCYDASYQFASNGWRIAYVQEETAYLISAGAPECMCTDSFGDFSTSCSNYLESSDELSIHILNLNYFAQKYCNLNFLYGNACNDNSAWNVNDEDFQKITGYTLLKTSGMQNPTFAITNSLIENSGLYWFATIDENSSVSFYNWYPHRTVRSANSNASLGIRPVLRLKSSVIVTGGSGTEDDPYVIGLETNK